MIRKYATEIKICENDTSTYKMKLIGEGTSCCCYKMEKQGERYNGNIIKEFYPLFDYTKREVMERVSENTPVKIALNANEKDKKSIELRKKSFLNMASTIEKIKAQYDKDKANQFVVPKLVETSLGSCYMCEGINGILLQDYINNQRVSYQKKKISFKQFLCNIFVFLYQLFCDLDKLHKAGFLNLDIKPQNLYYVTGNGEDDPILVRNLDFGSCQEIGALIEDLKKAYKSDEEDFESIEGFFGSTCTYYSSVEIKDVVKACLKGDRNEKELLKRLDYTAAIRLLLYSLCGNDENVCLSKMKFLSQLKNAFLDSGAVQLEDNYYEMYNVFYRIKKLVVLTTSDKRNPTSEEFISLILQIISILKGHVYKENQFENQCKNALIIHDNLSKKNGSLFRIYKHTIFGEGDNTFENFMSFCEKNKIKSPTELNEYLLRKC